MKVWYEFGPGKQIITRGVDFIRFQTSSQGYHSVIQGPPERTGAFTLESLDEGAGTAVIHSNTIFPRALDRGVLMGGIRLAGDIAYLRVDNSADPVRFQIRFVAGHDTPAPDPAQLDRADPLLWRVRDLEEQRERDHEFWQATNKTLKRAFTELRAKERELRLKNEELAENYDVLARNRDELLRMNQRAEQMFTAFAEILPGSVLNDKYEVCGKIGAGGFGVVFRGRDRNLERDVAIKIFRTPADGFNEETMERFRREGASACRVTHASAVSIFDSGVSVGGVPYLVMELLEGVTLAHLLQRCPVLTPSTILELLIPVCGVLAVAHTAGVIHRDIKPENIFLHRRRDAVVVKVLDFGIAKLLNEPERAQSTHTGSLLGTPIYIAPERLRGGAYDGRADIYSVGMLAYQLLAGRTPFKGEGEGPWSTFLDALYERPASLSEAAPAAPPEIAALVMRLLAADPNERPSASELVGHLDALRVLHPERGLLAELLASEAPAAEDIEDRALRRTLRSADTLPAKASGRIAVDASES
jgi:serine/threonine protein kinase